MKTLLGSKLWRIFPTKLLLIGIIILNTITLNSCNSALLESNASQVTQLVQAVLSDPKTFNLVISQDRGSSSVGNMMFEGLVTQNPITGEIETALAESWSVSEDKLKIVVKLKKGLKWSDGHPLTAEDVVFTFNDLYFNTDIPTGTRDILRVGQSQELPKVRKLNDLEIEFVLAEPFAPFVSIIGQAIFPEHILKKTVETKDKDGNLLFLSTWTVDTPPDEFVVNSAYKLKEYVNSQRIIFEANPYYWKKSENGETLPRIKKIVWQIVESQDTFLLQFRSGSLDSITVSPEYFSLLKKEEKRGNFTVYNGGASYGTTYITFNLNQGQRNGKPFVDPVKSQWFNNVKFRQAVAYAIDRQRINNNIYRGLGELQNSPISIQSPFYDENLKGYEYNLEKAKQLLTEAGFTYNKQGELFDSKGNRVTFSLITNSGNKIREAMGSQIQSDLGKIGIKVDFEPINFNTLTNQLDNSLDWECVLLGFTGGNEPNNSANLWDPNGSLHFFNQGAKPGQEPIEGRKVADWEVKIGQLFIEAARELELEKRKAIYVEVQEIVSENLPFIYLVNPLALGAVRNKIQTIEYSALGGAFWNLEELKITDE
ncbi:MAG: ABC transporter substrate-binding protein [Xenococcaceae cyanobacterium MO_207.B15]|nr:ABC transporter substrate-binding protein [Xenococcaceae cyanobacterium MO_207.B15]